ncbi:granzyme K-like [Pagrus major]|uniref:granzyme K-like n=1 Tax=Pagrus major TaxID=143350 RepID=UPI003CC8B571
MFCLRGFIVSISCVAVLIVQSSHGSEIINGKEVDPNSLPFMALLMNGQVCGGILIGQKWVLTAAHCAAAAPGKKEVLLGVHSYSAKDDSRQRIQIERQIPHPWYEPEVHVNDLMLLKLKKAAKKTKTVKWLPLGKTIKYPADGTPCLVAGWGKTDNEVNKMSDALMSANVTVINRIKCNSTYYGARPYITTGMICAGSSGKKVADTCQGDSGGPLLCKGVLVGVTSFGGPVCGVANKPGVYAFLSEKQLTWIQKTMKKSEI